MFVDEITIRVKAGDGGRGCVAFRREKGVPLGGPSGGDGGKGGDVILIADSSISNLVDLFYQPQQIGERGEHGEGKKRHGSNGADRVLRVPLGTLVRRVDTGEIVADLTIQDQTFLLARGGYGGKGNWHFRTATHQAPREYGPGELGEEGRFHFEMKTIADVGFVGYPNAGKSTLLSHISAAHPRVAAYPFTTLHPIVGTIEFPDYSKLVIADIPGLIEGASEGIGLGHEFLRHIERCKILVILVDMAGVDGRDPRRDYQQLLKELKLHNPELLKKPRVVVANKMDLSAAKKHLILFRKKYKLRPLVQISAEKKDGLEDFLNVLHKIIYPKVKQGRARKG